MTTIAQRSYGADIVDIFNSLGLDAPYVADKESALTATVSQIDGESWVSGSMQCITVSAKRKISLDYIDVQIIDGSDNTVLTVNYDRVLGLLSYGPGDGEIHQSVKNTFKELYRDLEGKVTFNQLKSSMSKARDSVGSLQLNRNVWYIPADSAATYAELTDELSAYGITTILVPLLPIREHIEPVVETYSNEISESLADIETRLNKMLRDGVTAPKAIDSVVTRLNRTNRLIAVVSEMTDEVFETSAVERKINKIKG